MPTLLLHPRYDDDTQLLWQEAVNRGWETVRSYYSGVDMARWRAREGELAIYGGHMWALEVARQTGVKLASPAPAWLSTLPRELLGRQIVLCRLADVVSGNHPLSLRFPIFVKSLSWPQEFASRVYHSVGDLPAGDPNLPVLASEVVRFEREFRFFCLDGAPVAWSPYARGAEGVLDTQLTRAEKPVMGMCLEWLADRLSGLDLPNSTVVDVGVLEPSAGVRRPVIVEANPAWCAGMYRCDPAKVLDVVRGCVSL